LLLALPGWSGLVLLGWSRRRSGKGVNKKLYLLTFLCLLSLGTFSACGGGGSGNGAGGGTPPGTYTVTVTGTFTSGSTNLTHSTKLTMVVQ
jgi:hypothetical protein